MTSSLPLSASSANLPSGVKASARGPEMTSLNEPEMPGTDSGLKSRRLASASPAASTVEMVGNAVDSKSRSG